MEVVATPITSPDTNTRLGSNGALLQETAHMPNRPTKIPFFGARKLAEELMKDLDSALADRDRAMNSLREIGALSLIELQERKSALEQELSTLLSALATAQQSLAAAKKAIVETEDVAILQEAGVYRYVHPLSDVVAYESRLGSIEAQIKAMVKKDGGAISATKSWTVNGSEAQGRSMVSDISKLMLRAFNAEADNLVRSLKPFKLASAVERLEKVAETIAKLGKSMDIRVSPSFIKLRVQELQLTADYLHKVAEDKEREREERERLKEERKAQQEMEREKLRLEKERQHYANALASLVASGDSEAAARLQTKLDEVQKAIDDVDYRAANIRAGYVYVISNIGSFGESLVKVGMTRRLDPMERIRELSDASVPFNYDVHAIFFSEDAVGIESSMHSRLGDRRCNLINLRREFFHATAEEAKSHLSELAGELLTFHDVAEALEYRQTLEQRQKSSLAVKS
jgi:hypothetical protein